MGRDLDRENDLLAERLGREHGYPRYQWRFSENLFMPMRKLTGAGTPAMDYFADEKSGLIVAKPVYELRKSAAYLHRQYVICRWLEPGTEENWLASFGTQVEYPRNGYYAPTNVYLDPEVHPWDTDEGGTSLTHHIIHLIQGQQRKTFADHLREGEEIVDYREKMKDAELEDMIMDLRLPFGHIPGSREGGVSLPSAASRAGHDAAFGSGKE